MGRFRKIAYVREGVCEGLRIGCARETFHCPLHFELFIISLRIKMAAEDVRHINRSAWKVAPEYSDLNAIGRGTFGMVWYVPSVDFSSLAPFYMDRQARGWR